MKRRQLLRFSQIFLSSLLLGTGCHPKPDQAKATGNKQRILVIGAGLAGLAAAQKLAEAGQEVLVLESRDRLGGRIWTSNQWKDTPLDMGASWIHGVNGNPLTELADSIQAQRIITRYESAIAYGASGTPLSAAEERNLNQWQRRVETLLRQAQDRAEDQSIQATIEQALVWKNLSPENRQLVEFLLNSTIEQEYAGSTEQLSTHWYDDSSAYSGDDALFLQGYRTIIDHLAAGLKIELNQVVETIDWSGAEVVVKTNRATYKADKAIATLPLGVLKTGKIQFTPELPAEKRQAIAALGMGVLNKCYLRFSHAFWPETVDWIQQIPPHRGEWTEWVSFMPAAKKPILLGFNAADHGRAIEAWNDKQIVASAMQSLKRLFGQNIPEPLGYQITRWQSDPFAYGSYSFNALGSTPKMRDRLAESLDDKLFFAGEATERKHFGSAHGAYLSGLRAAHEVNRSA